VRLPKAREIALDWVLSGTWTGQQALVRLGLSYSSCAGIVTFVLFIAKLQILNSNRNLSGVILGTVEVASLQ